MIEKQPNGNDCQICGRTEAAGVTNTGPNRSSVRTFDCPLCGSYLVNVDSIGSLTAAISDLESKLRIALSCATRQASDAGEPLTLRSADVEALAEAHMHTRVNDNVEKLLQLVARR